MNGRSDDLKLKFWKAYVAFCIFPESYKLQEMKKIEGEMMKNIDEENSKKKKNNEWNTK